MAYNNVINFIEDINEQHENYNFEFENGYPDYKNLDGLKRYYTYMVSTNASKKRQKSEYNNCSNFAKENYEKYSLKNFDCDGSGKFYYELTHDIYLKLWAWKKQNETTFGNIENVFNEVENSSFGGETMNSSNTITDKIVEKICNKNEELIEHKKGKFSINFQIELFANTETQATFIKHLKFFEGLEEYINAYHTIGNFCLVPAYFNGDRGSKLGLSDYWDLSLEYLQTYGWDKSKFTKDKFNKYVNYFFLWDYVEAKDSKNYIIKELSPHEYSEDSIKRFLKDTTKFIKRRGIFMVGILQIQKEISVEKYNEIRKIIFCSNNTFCGYEDVLNKITNILRNDEIAIIKIDKIKEKIENIKI
ncbi:MAG: hypothetical protein ACK5HP_04630 [Bacilli bacterium]